MAKDKPTGKSAQAVKAGKESARNRPTAAQKVARDAEVVRLRARGKSWPEVSKLTGLSVRQSQEVWKTFRESAKPFLKNIDALDWVVEQVLRYDSMIGQLSELSEDETAQHASRVGAIGTKTRVMQAQDDLLRDTGMLPRNLGEISVRLDFDRLLKRLFVTLDEMGVPVEVKAALLSVLENDESYATLPSLN